MGKEKLNHGGFTLIELLVVLVVMSILSLTLANFVAGWLQSSSQSEAEANLLSNAELALTKVNNDIALSGSALMNNSIADPNGPGGNQFGWASGSSTLILDKVAVNTSGQAIFSDEPSDYITLKDNIIYFLSGTTLYRRTLASGQTGDSAVTTCPSSDASASCPADNVVARGVTNWSITYYDINGNAVTPASARSIQLAITLSSQYGSKPYSSSYTTRMVFRND